MPQPTTTMTGLVGRAAELAQLVAGLDDAADGRGSAVLVSGEAGIGKTRLIVELSRLALDRGATVLDGRCIDLIGQGVPYFALIEALRGAPDAPASVDLGSLVGPFAAGRPDADGQLRLFDDVTQALVGLTEAAPVMLVLEDLHWADGSTLDFVSYLSRTIRHHRILLVGTYRSDEVNPGDHLGRLVVELLRAREARSVELFPLRSDTMRELLESCARRTLPTDLTDAIFHRSGGNPFFAEELLAAAERGEDALPRLLRDALLQRLAQVDAECWAVLRVAAAFGRDIPYRLLAALTAVAEPQLGRALREAVDHEVLVPDQATGAYRFRHALLAEVVYATILPGEQEELHERIAHALMSGAGAKGADGSPGELARHWDAAGQPVEAMDASLAAARAAEAVSGLAEAVRHLERAIELWPQVPAAEAIAGTDLAAVLAWAAELADLTGSGVRAADFVRRAIGLVDTRADPVRAALLYERLGGYLLPTRDRRGALAACRRAAALVPVEPPSAERAAVLTTLANGLMLSWRHAASRIVCEEALTTAAAIGDNRPALRTRGILGIDLCYLGLPDEALAHLYEAQRGAFECGSPRDVAHIHAMYCEVLIASGRPADATRVACEGLAAARRLGVERSFGSLLAGYAAEGCLETGDWDRADELLTGSLRAGTAFWGHYPHLLRAQLAIGRGAFASAREHLEAGALGAKQPTSAARHARVTAELAMWEQRPFDAAAAVEVGLARTPAGRDALQRSRFAVLGLRALAGCAQLATARRDHETAAAAQARADQLLAQARRSSARAADMTLDAAAWLALAEAEHASLAEGRPDPDLWQAAALAWDTLDRPYPAAQCRWRLAEALHATRRSAGEAGRAAREAYRVAGALGAVPLRRELELFAQRARIDLVGPQPEDTEARTGGFGLTAREVQVLRLLTCGYSNRDIAGELTISVKTASVHVSHILRKLGVTRRTQAAAIAQRLPVAAVVPGSGLGPGNGRR